MATENKPDAPQPFNPKPVPPFGMSCGCDLFAGRPISTLELQLHRRHTLEAMVIWELLRTPDKLPAALELSELRLKYDAELDKVFPQSLENFGRSSNGN